MLPFLQGLNGILEGCKLAVYSLLPIRKTPCAYTQNTLCLYAKFPRLYAK